MKTIVTITNKEYEVGTLVMFYSLLKNGNVDHFTFHVMVGDDINSTRLKGMLYGIAARLNKKVEVEISSIRFDNLGDNTLEFYKNALAKFNIFKLDYDELVFLDSDLLILSDVSGLFEIEEDFAVCLDTGTPTEFNTGVMHIKKKWLSEELFYYLLESAKNNFSYRGDQEHINNMVGKGFKALPTSYNTLKDSHRFLGSWISGVKILHYISKKPWHPYNPILHKAGNLECLNIDKLWFKYFDELNIKDCVLLKDRTELIKHVNSLYPNGVGVEVGVQRGDYSRTILENWDCRKLYLVDPWDDYEDYSYDFGAVSQEKHDDNLDVTKENIEPYEHKVEIIRDFSVEASDEFNKESLDFVYLDARHDAEGIRKDIEHWWPLIKKGGMLAGHDYANYNQPNNLIEVKEVVDEFFDDVNVTLDGPFPSWWVKKS
jgi:lipopolysaccharide biosynthesis glycosyltransferase